MSSLIERINERAHNHTTATDNGVHSPQSVAAPPATPEQVEAAERALGFPLPALLRELYLTVGNGGFGPGDGFIGVPTKSDDAGRITVVSIYRERRKRGASAPWPERFLTVCQWGCGIESCLDCTSESIAVIRLDPNMEKADAPARVPAHMQFARAAQVDSACWVERASFEEWLQAWVDGRQLFYLAYGDSDDDLDEEEDEEDGSDDE
ncbi:MAG: SMI1/KNR4 family protein [Capsulimonadaceae bacterium]